MNDFERSSEKYRPYVMWRLSLYSIDFHTREDFTQETLLRMWLQRDSLDFSDDVRTKAWLKVVAQRTAFKALRDRSALKGRTNTTLVAEVDDTPSESLEELFFTAREHSEVWMLVDTLRPNWRDALTLRFWNDLEYVDIAAKMDCTVDRVRHYVADGKKALIKILQED